MERRTVFDVAAEIDALKIKAREIDAKLQNLRLDRRSVQKQLDALYQERARRNQKSQARR